MKSQKIHNFLIHFLFSLLLPHIILAKDEPKQRPNCTLFECGSLGRTGYPFSNATNPECGPLVIDCKVEPPQIHQGGRNYDVKSILHNNTVLLHDQFLQRQLGLRSCNLDYKFKLPTSSRSFSFSSRTPNLTLYKCFANYRRFYEYDSIKIYTYTSCKEKFVLHYSYPDQLPSSLNETDKRRCSIIQLPLIAQPPPHRVWEKNPFALLTADFSFVWNVSSDCFNCYYNGVLCNTNRTEQFECHEPVPPHLKRSVEKKVEIGIGSGVGGCVLTGLVVLLIVYCRWRRKRYLDKSSALISSQNVSPDFSMMPDQEKGFLAPIFSYEELEEATNNFDDAKELGYGGFGTVYHGELKDGRVVAVKRLYENNGKRVEQFMNEVQILSRLRHKNLVILYGCTSRHSRELLLVYEFVPNGTVADHLHGERAGSGLVLWSVRMNIAIETADALKYLHVSEIIHRDVKTNNILLDENFHVKVADFGLSRLFPTDVTHVSTAPQGTPGYVDPEYYQCYQLTSKSDVYSFGVVLVELISSKPAVDISRHRHEINLSNLAINKIHNHALHELIDPSLGFETDSSVKKMITLVAELAFRCLQQDSDMRPSMTEVLEVLKEIENEGSKKAKGVEIDIAADDIGLLKNNISPFSPDSVTQRWDSDITPNTSS